MDLKPYSLSELSILYNVCNKTMKKWLEPIKNDIGLSTKRIYTTAQVMKIVDEIGPPLKEDKKEVESR